MTFDAARQAVHEPRDVVGSYNPRRRWWALLTLTFSLLAITTDMTILNVALPQISSDLEPTATQQLWIIDAYSLVMAGLLIPMSSLADRWGRRRMLITGYIVIAVASFLVIFAQSAAYVIALRLVLGVGGAMVMPSTLSLIRVIFSDPKERGRALAVWAAVAGIGAAVGPLLGGFLLEMFHWQAAFLISVPLMLIALVGAFFTLPESRVQNLGPWDVLAAVLALSGMTAIVWGIKKVGDFSWIAASGSLLVGCVLLILFIVRCHRSVTPLFDISLFRHRIFLAGVIAALVSSFSMSAGLLLLAQWLQLVNGASAMESGIQLMPLALAAAVSSLFAPKFAELIGMRAVVFAGLLISGGGMFFIGWAGASLSLRQVLIALFLIGAGIGALALASSMIMGGVPRSKAGNAAAMEDTAYELGAVLGIAILGSISSLMYRVELGQITEVEQLLPAQREAIEDSLGGALTLIDELGLHHLADLVGDAFTRGLSTTGLIGGAIMVLSAVLVFAITPRRTRFEDLEH